MPGKHKREGVQLTVKFTEATAVNFTKCLKSTFECSGGSILEYLEYLYLHFKNWLVNIQCSSTS